MTLLRKLINYHRLPLLEKLLRYADDYDIYSFFLECEPELHESVNSPLRDDDTCPSFCLFLPTRVKNVRPEEIWWKDQAKGSYGNVITFVRLFAMHAYGLSLKGTYQVVKFIDEEMQLGLFDSSKGIKPREKVKRVLPPKLNTDILFTSRQFTKADMEYWGKYHVITKEILNKYNVRSVHCLLNEDHTVRSIFPQKHIAFAYICFDKVKLYQPLMPREKKWRNTCLANYFFGLEQLEGKDTLIITKALKDIMCFKGLVDADVIAPQSETTTFKPKFIEYLKGKYKRIIVVMDYDLAGVIMANKLKVHFEVKFISTKRELIDGRLKCKTKDLSDFLEIKGVRLAQDLLEEWKLKLI